MLLACAFASVARRSQTRASGLWLVGWVLVAVHFAGFIFISVPGVIGNISTFIFLTALIWAGILFTWASIPYREEVSSRWMLTVMMVVTALYVGVLMVSPTGSWALIPAAALIGALPLTITLLKLREFNHTLRWVTVSLFCALSAFLLTVQNRHGNGPDLAINGILFTVYFDCCIHIWYTYRRATAGAFVTVAGFLAWASVFVVAPTIEAFWPHLHVEGEVWNLPKYVAAVGMILRVLEDQIEHNRFLALHDELTGLPNRRLFQDRLASALERARRSGTQTALLLIDLNQFKQVNDSFGHHVGDLLLRTVGSMFAGRVRRTDTVARTGGDEFSIILEGPTNREDAEHVCQALVQLLHEPLKLADQLVHATVSVGVAVFPEDALSMESLCIAADLKMYDRKRGHARDARRNRRSLSSYSSAAEA